MNMYIIISDNLIEYILTCNTNFANSLRRTKGKKTFYRILNCNHGRLMEFWWLGIYPSIVTKIVFTYIRFYGNVQD